MKNGMKIWCKKDIVVMVAFAFISTVYYLYFPVFPLILEGDSGSGALTLFYSLYSSICEGSLSLWSPYMWGGIPAIGHTYFQAIYPVNLAIYFILQNSSFELFIVIDYAFHLFVLCSGLYLFQRLNKISIPASFISTLTVAFSCEMMCQTHWTYLFTGFVWLPLIIDFIILFEKNTSQKAWIYVMCGGGILGLSGLANQGQTLLINILLSCILYLCFIGTNFSKEYFLELTGKMLSFGILGIALCSPALFPALEFSRNCMRFIPETGFLSGLEKMPVEAFIEYDVSFASIGALLQFPALNRDTNYYFVSTFSVMVSLFGIIGFFRKIDKSGHAVDIFAKICFAFVICYSTGFVLPYIFYYIPFYNAIREPFLYIPYLILPLVLFVGRGLDFMGSDYSIDSLKRNISFPICMCSTLLLCFIGIFMPYNLSRKNQIIAILVLGAFPGGFLLRRQKVIRKHFLSGLVLAAFVLQMGTNISQLSNAASYKDIWAKIERQSDEIITHIANHPNENERHLGLATQVWSLNSLSQNQMYDAQGYVNPVTRAGQLLQYMDLHRRALISNIKYWYTSADTEDWSYQMMLSNLNGQYLREIQVYPTYDSDEADNFAVWEMDTLGTAWVINDMVEIDSLNDLSDQQVADLLNSVSIDFRTQSYVAHPDNTISIESGENKWNVNTDEYSNNQIRFVVDSEKKAILTTSEIWYPGWNTYVDGKKQETLQVNCCFRGCEIPAGTHTIEFKYEPPALYLGLLFCALGISYCLGICFVTTHKKHKTSTINSLMCGHEGLSMGSQKGITE